MTVPPYYGFGQPLICSHLNAPIDPVTGDLSGSCDLMRSRNCCIHQCGIEGDWFEEKAPVVETEQEMIVTPYAEVSWFKRVFGGNHG